jgi:hypothetical protein
MQKRLRERFADHPLVGEVRGIGLVGAIELVADKAGARNFDPALKIGPRMIKAGEAEGVILRALANDTVAFSPPLIMTEARSTRWSSAPAARSTNLTVALRRESLPSSDAVSLMILVAGPVPQRDRRRLRRRSRPTSMRWRRPRSPSGGPATSRARRVVRAAADRERRIDGARRRGLGRHLPPGRGEGGAALRWLPAHRRPLRQAPT